MVTESGGGSAETSELSDLLVALVDLMKGRIDRCAEAHGLSAAQAQALLHVAGGVSMRTLAERLGCHASNVTGTADRLVARGLVERRDDPVDRRVKRIALTATGESVRATLLAELAAMPTPVDRLTAEQRRQLTALLRQAVEATGLTDPTRDER